MQYKLGHWSVFPNENKLLNLNSQEEVRVEPKSMAALMLFIDSPGEVIAIDEFMLEVWQGRTVGDHAVYRTINQLRKSLNPDDKNAFIINIPKLGYKLIETVVLVSSEAEDESIEPQSHQSPKSASNPKKASIDIQPTSENEKVPVQVKTFKINRWMLGLFLLTLGALFYWYFFQPTSDLTLKYKNTTPLTTDMVNKSDPYFSADGAYVVYSKQTAANEPYRLNILNLTSNRDEPITATENNDLKPVLSADAQRLVFIRRNAEHCRVMLIDNPLADDKKETELFACDWQNMDLEITQDGKTLYYTQATPPNNRHKIHAYTIDTGKAVQLTTIKNVNSQGDRNIALSPNNNQLAFLRDKDWKYSELGILDLNDYTEKFYTKTGSWYNSLAWTPDNNHIIHQESNRSLSLFSLKNGRSEIITSAFTEDILSIGHNAANSDLVVAFGQKKGGIYIRSNPLMTLEDDETQLNAMLIQSTEIDAFPSFANHSKQMAFMSKRSGSAQIWLKTEIGEESQITRYTDRRSVRTIRWSPDDGRLLTENKNAISYIDLTNNKEVILVAEGQYGSVGAATWSRDGSGIFFTSDISDDNQIYRLDIANGIIKQVTTKGGIMAFPSSDENELYILKHYQGGLVIHNRQTGQEDMLVENIKGELHRSIHVKQSGIYYVSNERQIKKYDFNTQQTIDIDIDTELMVPVLTVSDDEKWFAFPYYNKVENSIYILSQ